MVKPMFNKHDLDTPSLLIDLDAMERNIQRMADYFRERPAALRPHTKTHKIPQVAHMQIRAGAIGVTCQKLGEAEVFARAGIGNILISNQIAGAVKINRFVNLSRWADVTVGLDSAEVAREIAEAARAAGVVAKVAIEVSIVRCGVEPGAEAVRLAQDISKLKGLEFVGIWAHEAGCSPTFDLGTETSLQRRKAEHCAGLMSVLETKHLIEQAGIPVHMFSTGHTATYNITADFPEVTDVQAGTYVFMDWPYRQLEGLEEFEEALSVLATVISIPRHQRDRAYLDCGTKSIASEHTSDYSSVVYPKLRGELRDRVEVVGLSEEHGHLQGDVGRLHIGEKLELIPAHACTTTPRFDVAYVVSGESVVAEWPIEARDGYR